MWACCLSVPESTAHSLVLPPVGSVSVTGLAHAYSSTYPSELTNILPRNKFDEYLGRINDVVDGYWPCKCCWQCSYVLSVCTCCLTCLPLCVCFCEAEHKLGEYLYVISHQPPYILWSLKRKGLSTWIQLDLRDQNTN